MGLSHKCNSERNDTTCGGVDRKIQNPHEYLILHGVYPESFDIVYPERSRGAQDRLPKGSE